MDYVLEGSAQREGGRLRISAELIHVRGAPELDSLLDRGFAEGGSPEAMKRGAEARAVRAANVEVAPTDIASLYVTPAIRLMPCEWLERAYEARDPNLLYLRLPVYDPLRSEPRFQSLLRRMNLPVE